MWENLSRDPPRQSAPEPGVQLIPDPWEATEPSIDRESIRISWQLPSEPHPLIAPTEKLDALYLPAPTFTANLGSIQVVLLSGLKLKAYEGGKLTEQIQKVLALLQWMGTASQEAPEVVLS